MKKYFLVLFAAILLIIEPISAFAEKACAMPPIEDRAADMTIYFYIEHNGIDVPISGAKMAVYKVADISCIGGSPEYTLLPEYRSLQKKRKEKDVTFDGLTAAQSAELAEELSAITGENYNMSAITGADGKCSWYDIPHGMYLIKEIDAQDAAVQYETIAPYLVSLPLGFQSEEDGYWIYDVLSKPKTTVMSKHDTDSDSESDSYSDKDKNTDTDISPGGNTPTYNTPTYNTTTYTPANTVTPTPITDIEKVKTGVVTNVMSLFVILILSLIIIVIAKDKHNNNSE